jgi:uncharacterized membrane protein YcaP (DUF421 family)
MYFPLEEYLEVVLGRDGEPVTGWQMAVRAFAVFFLALLMVRIAGMRALGKKTAFDVLLNILLGAVLSRAITGSSPFFPTVFASMVLVVLHKLLSRITYYNERLGHFFKGESVPLYQNGKFLRENMRRNDITENDLMVSVRECGIGTLEEIEEVYFERSGKVSVIPKKRIV